MSRLLLPRAKSWQRRLAGCMSSVIEHPACRRGPAGGNGSGVPVVLVDGGRRQSPGSQHSGLTPWPLLLPPAPLPDSGAGSASPEIRNGTFVPVASCTASEVPFGPNAMRICPGSAEAPPWGCREARGASAPAPSHSLHPCSGSAVGLSPAPKWARANETEENKIFTAH